MNEKKTAVYPFIVSLVVILGWPAMSHADNNAQRIHRQGSVPRQRNSVKVRTTPRIEPKKRKIPTASRLQVQSTKSFSGHKSAGKPHRSYATGPRSFHPVEGHGRGVPPQASRSRRNHNNVIVPRYNGSRYAEPRYAAPKTRTNRTAPFAPHISRGRHEYSQKVVTRGGRELIERSRDSRHDNRRYNGRHVRHYHRHYWRNRNYYVYVHHWSYNPWFWGFYFAPFTTPWVYTWAWVNAPWHHTLGWYYHPYPRYIAPSYWVTDYIISKSLEEAYQQGYIDGQRSEGTPISEPVKEQLRIQVDDTAKSFQANRSIVLEQALQNPNHLFVVDIPISVTTEHNTICALTSGDIIKPAGNNPPDSPAATMVVVTSKSETCSAGSLISVSFEDLQEMLNSFSEKVDDGMNELQRQHDS